MLETVGACPYSALYAAKNHPRPASRGVNKKIGWPVKSEAHVYCTAGSDEELGLCSTYAPPVLIEGILHMQPTTAAPRVSMEASRPAAGGCVMVGAVLARWNHAYIVTQINECLVEGMPCADCVDYSLYCLFERARHEFVSVSSRRRQHIVDSSPIAVAVLSVSVVLRLVGKLVARTRAGRDRR